MAPHTVAPSRLIIFLMAAVLFIINLYAPCCKEGAVAVGAWGLYLIYLTGSLFGLIYALCVRLIFSTN